MKHPREIRDKQGVLYAVVDFGDPAALEAHAKWLEGRTFQDVLDLGIVAREEGGIAPNTRNKGELGSIIEEHFFGYKVNSSSEPDFVEAGTELKATPYDVTKGGRISAGERLILSMIPNNAPIEDEFLDAPVAKKSTRILLVVYERDRTKAKHDQVIRHVHLFTPSEEDLQIIVDDYRAIRDLIVAGRADELSESQTMYLGAATKGATAERSIRPQYYYPHTPAKSRAFCFKRQYMDYILHERILADRPTAEPVVRSAGELRETTFEELVLQRINPHKGMLDAELFARFDINPISKSRWSSAIRRMLGVTGGRVEEFEKGNISVRTIRREADGSIRESLSLNHFAFADLIAEAWDESELNECLSTTRFLFVVFDRTAEGYVLAGAAFWSMPVDDLEGDVRKCWEATQQIISDGVVLTPHVRDDGSIRVSNNLPKASGNRVSHVRPHTSKSAYRLADGTTIGNVASHASELPDGQWMTKQSFWLNSSYVRETLVSLGL